jgi:hypothetical protein
MLPSTFHDALAGLPLPLLAVLAVVAGAALLATIGMAQWTVLRRHVERSGSGSWPTRWPGWLGWWWSSP